MNAPHPESEELRALRRARAQHEIVQRYTEQIEMHLMAIVVALVEHARAGDGLVEDELLSASLQLLACGVDQRVRDAAREYLRRSQ